MMSGIQNSSAYSSVYATSHQARGSKLDANQDDALDLQELESFSKKQTERTGTSFDAQEVLSKYDSNEDGLIDKTEGTSLREDNALNMPSKEEMQAQMMSRGGNRPQGAGPPPAGTGGNVESTDGSVSIDALLEALEDGESTYSAAEIAQYDTNGDGDIDSIEEIAMNALIEDSQNETENVAQSLVDKALEAYSNQNNFDLNTLTASNDASATMAV